MILILSILSSIFYRAGGLSKDAEYWIPKWMRHGWVRDFLCPLCFLAPIYTKGANPYVFLITYILTVMSLRTYWDRLFKKDNFAFSGLMVGVAAFPLYFTGCPAGYLVSRAIFIALSWGILCAVFSLDHIEEHGRGFLASISTLFLI